MAQSAATQETVKRRVRKVSQGIRLNGFPTTLSMEPVYWEALDQIAANTNLSSDDVITAFAANARIMGRRAATVRLGVILYFRHAQNEGFARKTGKAVLQDLVKDGIEYQGGKVKVSAKSSPIVEHMPKEYWEALENMRVFKNSRGVIDVSSLVNRSTYAWATSQIGIAALKHYHRKAPRARFPKLTS